MKTSKGKKGKVTVFLDDGKWVGCEIEVPYSAYYFCGEVEMIVEVTSPMSVYLNDAKSIMDYTLSYPLCRKLRPYVKLPSTITYRYWIDFTNYIQSELSNYYEATVTSSPDYSPKWDAIFHLESVDHCLVVEYHTIYPPDPNISHSPYTFCWRGTLVHKFCGGIFIYLFPHTFTGNLKATVNKVSEKVMKKWLDLAESLVRDETVASVLCKEVFDTTYGIPYSQAVVSGVGGMPSGVHSPLYGTKGTPIVGVSIPTSTIEITPPPLNILSTRVHYTEPEATSNYNCLQYELPQPLDVSPSVMKVIGDRRRRRGKPTKLMVKDEQIRKYFFSLLYLTQNEPSELFICWSKMKDNYDFYVYVVGGMDTVPSGDEEGGDQK